MVDKTRFTNLDRITIGIRDKADTIIKDGEIRAYWYGAKETGASWTDCMEKTTAKFNTTEESVKRALYDPAT